MHTLVNVVWLVAHVVDRQELAGWRWSGCGGSAEWSMLFMR